MKIIGSEWVVSDCAHAEAVALIESLHYSGGAPNTSVYRHALRRVGSSEILGVALWLPPTPNAARSVSSDPRGVLALSRFCLAPTVPKNGASFLLGRSMKMMDRSRWPVLLTYADTRQGHTGAIYKATNWDYLGVVPGADAWVDSGGVQRGRKRGGKNLSAHEMAARGYTRLPPAAKHKFVHRATL